MANLGPYVLNAKPTAGPPPPPLLPALVTARHRHLHAHGGTCSPHPTCKCHGHKKRSTTSQCIACAMCVEVTVTALQQRWRWWSSARTTASHLALHLPTSTPRYLYEDVVPEPLRVGRVPRPSQGHRKRHGRHRVRVAHRDAYHLHHLRHEGSVFVIWGMRRGSAVRVGVARTRDAATRCGGIWAAFPNTPARITHSIQSTGQRISDLVSPKA